MPDRLGRVPVTAEVNAFEGKVRRDERIPPSEQAQHGAVVSDSGKDGAIRTTSAPAGLAADLGD